MISREFFANFINESIRDLTLTSDRAERTGEADRERVKEKQPPLKLAQTD
jgi:hypothetical protein